MLLVIDANVLFSSLIKDGMTCKLLFRDEFVFYAPDFLLDELSKHKELLLSKTNRSAASFEEVLDVLLRRINFVSFKDLVPYLFRASRICPDENDLPYFCLALKLGCGIWSQDKRLAEQNIVRIWRTEELLC